jgi:hypothetical protein
MDGGYMKLMLTRVTDSMNYLKYAFYAIDIHLEKVMVEWSGEMLVRANLVTTNLCTQSHPGLRAT